MLQDCLKSLFFSLGETLFPITHLSFSSLNDSLTPYMSTLKVVLACKQITDNRVYK